MKKFMVFAVALFALTGCSNRGIRAAELQLAVEEAHNISNNPELFCKVSGYEIIVQPNNPNAKVAEINVSPAIWKLEAELSKDSILGVPSRQYWDFYDVLNDFWKAKCNQLENPKVAEEKIRAGERLLTEIGPVGSNLPKHLRPIRVDL